MSNPRILKQVLVLLVWLQPLELGQALVLWQPLHLRLLLALVLACLLEHLLLLEALMPLLA